MAVLIGLRAALSPLGLPGSVAQTLILARGFADLCVLRGRDSLSMVQSVLHFLSKHMASICANVHLRCAIVLTEFRASRIKELPHASLCAVENICLLRAEGRFCLHRTYGLS